MQIEIAQEIIDRYPNYRMGILSISTSNRDYKRLKEKLTEFPVDFPLIKQDIETTWLKIFADMGASERRLPSVVSLWRLIERYGHLQDINYFVDVYNHISVKYGIPIGGYDISKFPHAALTLRFANKGDEFQPLGLNQIEKLKGLKEIVYYSGEQVVCRYWNNKDSELTKIDDTTNNVLITFDYFGSEELLIQAIDELYAIILETSDVLSKYTAILDSNILQVFL